MINIRACFKKIKAPGIGRFVKSAFFEMKLIKNNFSLGGIQTPSVFLDCPSALLSNKGTLLLKRENNLIQFFHSIRYGILDYESKLLQIKTSTFS